MQTRGEGAGEEDEVMNGTAEKREGARVEHEGATAPAQTAEDVEMSNDEQDEAVQVRLSPCSRPFRPSS